jgi:sulfide:quinone oxidoreductase
MARLLILGAGIAGHTAAMHARRKLGQRHEIVVVSPNRLWNWIPSNIWVGVGFMTVEDVTFELAPVYRRLGIPFHQARAVALYPEGTPEETAPQVEIEYTDPARRGEKARLTYDYLINATGPRLNFGATPGLGPEGHSVSVCTHGHAAEAFVKLGACVERMRAGARQKILIGTGHGTCTCQGAAFEYLLNVEHYLRRQKVRDRAELVWISNEQEVGDFGVGGLHIKRGGYVTHSRIFAESLLTERDIRWITQAAVREVLPDRVLYERLDGTVHEETFDFAMLLPPFSGVGLKAVNGKGEDITGAVFAGNGFMKVDGDYKDKPYAEWTPEDWPRTYQSPLYPNVFAAGIAFAPPHAISKPMKSVNGTPIFPTPPRTGMPSGVMARQIALNIADLMSGRATEPRRTASLARMGAACIASAGAGWRDGTAVSMTMYPIIPDFKTYPQTGRCLRYTTGEIGLAGHWIKHLLHFGFLYKAKARPFWMMIPE